MFSITVCILFASAVERLGVFSFAGLLTLMFTFGVFCRSLYKLHKFGKHV